MIFNDVKQAVIRFHGLDNFNCPETRANMEARLLLDDSDFERLGLRQVSYDVNPEGEMSLMLEVAKEATSIGEIDQIFHHYWWQHGVRDYCYVEQNIEGDEVVYNYVSGFHSGPAQSGKVVLSGSIVERCICRYRQWKP